MSELFLSDFLNNCKLKGIHILHGTNYFKPMNFMINWHAPTMSHDSGIAEENPVADEGEEEIEVVPGETSTKKKKKPYVL